MRKITHVFRRLAENQETSNRGLRDEKGTAAAISDSVRGARGSIDESVPGSRRREERKEAHGTKSTHRAAALIRPTLVSIFRRAS